MRTELAYSKAVQYFLPLNRPKENKRTKSIGLAVVGDGRHTAKLSDFLIQGIGWIGICCGLLDIRSPLIVVVFTLA